MFDINAKAKFLGILIDNMEGIGSRLRGRLMSSEGKNKRKERIE